jgi:hypothetical protein
MTMKQLRALACAFATMSMAIVLTGCGGGGGGGGEAPALDAPVVGVWEAETASVNGDPTSVPAAMGLDASVDRVVSVFWHDGTRTTYAYAGDLLLDSSTATWTVRGNTVAVTTSAHTLTCQCTVSIDTLTMRYRDGGNDVVVVWSKYRPAGGAGLGGVEYGTHTSSDLVGTWEAVSATVNGRPAPVLQVRGCDPSVTCLTLRIHGYGTLTQYAFCNSQVFQKMDGMWAAAHTSMTIYWCDCTETFDFDVSDRELVMSYNDGAARVVVVWAKTN